jgi:hypothetical protein
VKGNFLLLITLYDYSRPSAMFHVVPKNLQWNLARQISGEFLLPLEYCNILYLSETDINTFFCFYQFIIRKEKAMVTLITKYVENLFYDALKKRQLLPCVFLSKINIALIAVSLVTTYSLLLPVARSRQRQTILIVPLLLFKCWCLF